MLFVGGNSLCIILLVNLVWEPEELWENEQVKKHGMVSQNHVNDKLTQVFC